MISVGNEDSDLAHPGLFIIYPQQRGGEANRQLCQQATYQPYPLLWLSVPQKEKRRKRFMTVEQFDKWLSENLYLNNHFEIGN